MGFRFRQKIKIFPGIYINLGKKGINSTSIRAGWFTANINKDGIKKTISAHGTGLSYETKRNKLSTKVFWIVICLIVLGLVFG